MQLPLAGLRVVEIDAGVDVGYAGKLLADAGAGVTRLAVTPPDGDEAVRRYLDANKQTRPLDPASPAWPAADLVIAGVGGRRGERSGLTPESLRAGFGRAVAVLLTPHGWDVPDRFREYDDLVLQAEGGVSLYIGEPGRPPLNLPFNQSLFQGGLAGAIAGVSAVAAGQAVTIDLALCDIWASIYSGPELANAWFGRGRKGRAGFRTIGTPFPREILRCRDGYFAIQCSSRGHWRAFLAMTGQQQVEGLDIFANRLRANDEHIDEANGYFTDFFASRTKQELLELVLEHKIPGAPVLEVAELLDNSHLAERGFFAEVENGSGTLRAPGRPYHLAGPHSPTDPRRRATQRRDPWPGPRSSDELPLAGLRVLDFGWVWAGAVPGHILATLGAEVIKVESRARLDYMRQGRPLVGDVRDPEQNPMFQTVNGGKLSVTIDFTTRAGAEIVHDLVRRSDVVIENFTPGVMSRYGIDWPTLSAINPNLVMCSMSPAGQTGSLRGLRTYAMMIAALSGMDSVVAYEGERVLGMQQSYPDPNASLHATFAILACLVGGRRDGGQHIDLSQWESGAALVGGEVVAGQLRGDRSDPSTRVEHAPYGNYPTRGPDRWIAIAVRTDAEWRALLRVLMPDTAGELAKLTRDERRRRRDEIDALISAATTDRDGDQLAARLRDGGVPAGVCAAPLELLARAEFVRRNLFDFVQHDVIGRVPVYNLPWLVPGTPRPSPRPGPKLGEHNEFVLSDILDYDQARVAELLAGPELNA